MDYWGPAIREQVRESKRIQKERGFYLCENPSEIHVCKGNECRISGTEGYRKRCKRGDGRYVGFFHTHPGGNSERDVYRYWKGDEQLYTWHNQMHLPSSDDIQAADTNKETISCVASAPRKHPTKMLCFSPVEKDMNKLSRIVKQHHEALQRYVFAVAPYDAPQSERSKLLKDYEKLFHQFMKESKACQVSIQ